MQQFVSIFSALSDRTRLRIILLLSKANTGLCVCEIMDSLNESQYNISRHLRELKIAGLVQEHKEGRWVYYSLTTPKVEFHRLILQAVLSLPEKLLFLENKRLKKRLSLRKDGKCVVGISSEKWRKILNQVPRKRSRIK